MGLFRILLIFGAIWLWLRLVKWVVKSFLMGYNQPSSNPPKQKSAKQTGKINYDNTQIEDAYFEEIK